MATVGEVRRVALGYFVRPADETETGQPRVEPCLAYLVPLPDGMLLLDTGMGSHPVVDARYRPVRLPLAQALSDAGVGFNDVRHVANCHLHFDHCGGNPLLAGRPIYVQQTELAEARTVDRYTLPELVDFDGARYEQLDGESQIAANVWLIPTPGHTPGHQSLVVRCSDGTVVLAGQARDQATAFAGDQLAWRARAEGVGPPLPDYPRWMERLMEFDPRRVLFAHDQSVWEPA
jgi:N-acyl homoserine lactone hydrolase